LRQLELYSPISPLWTGTATYFEHVVRRLKNLGFGPQQVAIIIDKKLFGQTAVPPSYMGFPVRDVAGESAVVAAGCSRIFFLANNEWHGYIFKALSKARAVEGGRIISVVHEPSVAIVMEALTKKGVDFFPDQFAPMIAPQFGDESVRLTETMRKGGLPEIFGFTTHAQGIALLRSHEIWTHSRFAAFKLALESEAFSPRLRIASHPKVPPVEVQNGDLGDLVKRDGITRIGVFGWVTRAKRIMEIMRGFALALDRLSPIDQGRLELVVVGALPSPRDLDIAQECKSLGIQEHTKILSFVSADRFSALIGSCDLVFNLRYPSCGETSGTLAHAAGRRVRTVTSRYQAFAEEEASLKIAPVPIFEDFAIAGAIVAALEGRDEFFEEIPSPQPRAAPVDKLIALEALGALEGTAA